MEKEAMLLLKYILISLGMIAIGVGIRIYMQKTGLNNLKSYLGVSLYYWKFASLVLIFFGTIALIGFSVALYYYFQY